MAGAPKSPGWPPTVVPPIIPDPSRALGLELEASTVGVSHWAWSPRNFHSLHPVAPALLPGRLLPLISPGLWCFVPPNCGSSHRRLLHPPTEANGVRGQSEALATAPPLLQKSEASPRRIPSIWKCTPCPPPRALQDKTEGSTSLSLSSHRGGRPLHRQPQTHTSWSQSQLPWNRLWKH